jgi:hypothetical protein
MVSWGQIVAYSEMFTKGDGGDRTAATRLSPIAWVAPCRSSYGMPKHASGAW